MKMIRQPVYDTKERPFLIIWETTQACDLACRHCRAESSPNHDPLALSYAEGCQLIDQIEGFGAPRPLFIMTGGDPFKRQDIFDLARYGAEKGLPVALSPSGTPLLNETNLTRIREAGANVISLSLDGSNAALHDDFRRVPGSFEWTVNGWKKALSMGMKIQLNTTVTRYNLRDLPDIFSLVRQLGVMTWSVFFLVPTGRALMEDQISADDCEAVMHFLYDCSKYVGCKTTEGHHYKRVVLQRSVLEARGVDYQSFFALNDTYYELKARLNEVTRGTPPPAERMRRTPMHINSAQGFVFISLKGDVYPSGYLPMMAGNVREKSLNDIYRDSPLFQSLRNLDELNGRCGRCEFRAVCGGSRSRAYGTYGNVLAEEPLCTYQPGSFPYMEDVGGLLHPKE